MSDKDPLDDGLSREETYTDSGDIVSFHSDVLSEEYLHRIYIELKKLGHKMLPQRVEIERRNLVDHVEYSPKFTRTILTRISLSLINARCLRQYQGEHEVLEEFDDIGQALEPALEGGLAEKIVTKMGTRGIEPAYDDELNIARAVAGKQSIHFSDAFVVNVLSRTSDVDLSEAGKAHNPDVHDGVDYSGFEPPEEVQDREPVISSAIDEYEGMIEFEFREQPFRRSPQGAVNIVTRLANDVQKFCEETGEDWLLEIVKWTQPREYVED